MVTVPSSFAPQVSYDPGGMVPVQAPEVQPAENRAPAQQVDMGQKMVTAGTTVLKIGQRIQDEIDESETKAADLNALREANELLRGENGYLTATGKDAETRYAETQQRLGEIFANTSQRLTNDVQRRMFEAVGMRNMLSIEGQMAQHKFTQVHTYSVNESTAREGMYIAEAARYYTDRDQVDAEGNPIGAFNVAINTALSEADNRSRLNGWDLNGSQAEAARIAVRTSITTGVINNLLNDDQVTAARSYFDQQLEAGYITDEVAIRLSSVLDGTEDRIEVINAVDRITSGTSNVQTNEDGQTTARLLSPLEASFPTVDGGQFGANRDGGTRRHNGRDYAAPVGTPVRAPFGGEVIQVWTDTKYDGGLSMRVRLDNGDIVGFAHLSATDVRSGRVEQGDIVARTGESGAGGPHLHYTIRRNGVAIDPLTANDTESGAVAGTPINSTQGSLDAALAVADREYADRPEMRDQIKSGIRQNWGQIRQAEEVRDREVLERAEEIWFANGGDWRKIPATDWAQLRPGDRRRLQEGIPRKTDEDLMLQILANPEMATAANLPQYRSRLSEGDYRTLWARANSPVSPEPVRAATLDNDQLYTIFRENGLEDLISPRAGTPEAGQSIMMQNRIGDLIDEEQTSTGRELTRPRKRELMQQVVLDQAFIDEWGRDPKMPVSMMEPDELEAAYVMVGSAQIPLSAIPAAFRQAAIQALTNAGRPVSEQAIANRWVRAGRPR